MVTNWNIFDRPVFSGFVTAYLNFNKRPVSIVIDIPYEFAYYSSPYAAFVRKSEIAQVYANLIGTNVGDVHTISNSYNYPRQESSYSSGNVGGSMTESRTILYSTLGKFSITAESSAALIQVGATIGADFTVSSKVNTISYYGFRILLTGYFVGQGGYPADRPTFNISGTVTMTGVINE